MFPPSRPPRAGTPRVGLSTDSIILYLVLAGLFVGLVIIGLSAGFGSTDLSRINHVIDRIKEIKEKIIDVCTKLIEMRERIDEQHREILEAIEDRNCEIIGVQQDDGCIFSTQGLIDARALAVAFNRKTSGIWDFFATFSPNSIPSDFPQLKYAKTPTEQAAYPFLQE